jgi:RNA polymerase sigma-70 factor, ECF subfamily
MSSSEQRLTEPQLDAWLNGARMGDEAACEALYHRFHPNVLRLCLGLLGNMADAEEVAQDSFVYALSRLSQYDPSRSAFSSWLYTIALSRCRNKRRRKWLVALPLEILTAEHHVPLERQVEAVLERRGVRRRVWEALHGLPSHLREAVALRFLGELRYKDLGSVLGCNPKTAESRVRLGLAAMRKTLAAQGVDAVDERTEQWVW